MRRAHEHFCSVCFGRTGVKTTHKGGWWRCLDRKCTRLPVCLCRKHWDSLAVRQFEHLIREAIVQDAGRLAMEAWNDLPFADRRLVSLTDFQSAAVAVAVLREVAERVAFASALADRDTQGAAGERRAYTAVGAMCRNALAEFAPNPMATKGLGQ